jgi:hypothetical protein
MGNVDLALVKTSEIIQGTTAVLPPPGFKPRGTIILVKWTEGKVHPLYEPGYLVSV